MTLVPLWDLDSAVEEVMRTAEKGTRAVAFSENPTHLGLPSIFTGHWARLFAAVAEADLPLCLHIGSSSELVKSSEDANSLTWVSLVGVNSMLAAADWIFSGILQQNPNLRVAFSEGGAGWAPYVLERIDYAWKEGDFTQESILTLGLPICFESGSVCVL